MNERTATIVVEIIIPPGRDANDVEEYVDEAVRNWCKTLSPGGETPDMGPDYFYHADQNVVRVVNIDGGRSAAIKITRLRHLAEACEHEAREIEREMERIFELHPTLAA